MDTIDRPRRAAGIRFRDGCRPPDRAPPVTAEAAQPPLRPLPIRPGPVSGESTFSYVRRLAVANHLRPMHLRRYLKDPGPGGGLRLSCLPSWPDGPSPPCSMRSLTRSLPPAPPHAAARPTRAGASGPRQNCSRSSAATPASAACRRERSPTSTEPQADRSRGAPVTPSGPAQAAAARGSLLDPFTAIIDDMLQAELQAFPPQRQPVISIYRELVTRHGADRISYQMVRKYAGRRRAVMQHQTALPSSPGSYGPRPEPPARPARRRPRHRGRQRRRLDSAPPRYPCRAAAMP